MAKSTKSKKIAKSTNRDVNRQNKANTVVTATIYSQIVFDGLSKLNVIIKDTTKNDNTLQQLQDIIGVCIKANSMSCKQYMRSSTYIKCAAYNIAKRENSMIKRGLKFREIDDLSSSMDHLEAEMLEMHKTIYGYSTACPYSPPITPTLHNLSCGNPTVVPTSTLHNLSCDNPTIVPTPSPNPTIVPTPSPYTCLTTTLNPKYDTFSVDPPQSFDNFYTPLETVKLIANRADDKFKQVLSLLPDPLTRSFPIKKISEHLIMIVMVQNFFVPVNITTLYKIMNEFKKNRYLEIQSLERRE